MCVFYLNDRLLLGTSRRWLVCKRKTARSGLWCGFQNWERIV